MSDQRPSHGKSTDHDERDVARAILGSASLQSRVEEAARKRERVLAARKGVRSGASGLENKGTSATVQPLAEEALPATARALAEARRAASAPPPARTAAPRLGRTMAGGAVAALMLAGLAVAFSLHDLRTGARDTVGDSPEPPVQRFGAEPLGVPQDPAAPKPEIIEPAALAPDDNGSGLADLLRGHTLTVVAPELPEALASVVSDAMEESLVLRETPFLQERATVHFFHSEDARVARRLAGAMGAEAIDLSGIRPAPPLRYLEFYPARP